MSENVPVRISATPEARDAIARLVAKHGPVMFHTSGGRVGGRDYPICLPLNELRLGARDHLLGEVDGAPIYEMEDREGGSTCPANGYLLDVASGLPIGFSIAAAPGLRFILRAVRSNATCKDETLKSIGGGSA